MADIVKITNGGARPLHYQTFDGENDVDLLGTVEPGSEVSEPIADGGHIVMRFGEPFSDGFEAKKEDNDETDEEPIENDDASEGDGTFEDDIQVAEVIT